MLPLLLLLLNVAAALIPVISHYMANTASAKQNDTPTLVSGPIDPLGGK